MTDTASLRAIDFHTHHIPARFEVTAGRTAPANQQQRWQALAQKLADEALLMKDIRDGAVSARVVNIPAQLIAGPDGRVPHETIVAINDELAALVARYPGQIYGLASVDGYDGDVSAREAERAIRELGMRGIFMDCARGEMMIDAPQTRPTLEVAARLNVPVFVHPVAPQALTRQMAPYGVVGTLFARGTTNSASLIALVEGGVFSQLPGLRVVVTAIAFGGLAMAAALESESRLDSGTIAVLRRNVWIDTMWPQPALIRAAVDLLGHEHVIAGSDWPIVDSGSVPDGLAQAMQRACIPGNQQNAIASGNCRRLLGL
jgi:predicted TIM-barrel fold metal-dependent hydrolase